MYLLMRLMKLGVLVAFLASLATSASSLYIPKGYKDAVRFSRIGIAEGRLSEHKFMAAVLYTANDVLPVGKPVPQILVIHCDKVFGEWIGVDETTHMSLFTPVPGSKQVYELWLSGDVSEVQMTIAVITIFKHYLSKTPEEMLVVGQHVLHELKNEPVSVDELKTK